MRCVALGMPNLHPAFCCVVIACLSAAPSLSGQDTKTHVRAVEEGLGSAVSIKNRPAEYHELLAEMQRLHVPGVSLAVIHDGRLEWAKGYGTSGGGTSPVTKDTLFQAASISKSLTAMGALKLVEQGKLSLDAPVQTALRSWTLPSNSFTQLTPVTLRELLSHTAGTSVHGFEGYGAGEEVPTIAEVLDGSKPANSAPVRVEVQPGTEFRYSGGGYTIVQQMMIDQTGQRFSALMQDLVLKPIGMTSSTFKQPLEKSELAKVALPFDAEGRALPGGPHTYPEMAAAGLWTTPSDLARWIIEMQRSLQDQANHVLSVNSTRTMLTPVKNGYALGVGVQSPSGTPALSHSGANEGYRCIYFAYQKGEGVVIMTNSDNGEALFGEILGSIAREYHWADYLPEERTIAPVPLAQLLQFKGKYKVKGGPAIEITADKTSLRLSISGGEPRVLYPSSSNSFFVTEDPLQLTFSSSDAGALVFGSHLDAFERIRDTTKP